MKRKIAASIAFVFFSLAWGFYFFGKQDPIGLITVGFMWLAIAGGCDA